MYGQPAQNAPAVFSACQVQFFFQSIGCIFSSLIDDLFFAFSGQWKYGGACQSTAGPQKEKRLVDPKMPLQEGKRPEKSALAGLGGRKSCARPEKAEKTGLES